MTSRTSISILGGYMLAKTLIVFYVWSPDIFVLSFYQNLFSGIAYSIMSNKTLPYHICFYKHITISQVGLCLILLILVFFTFNIVMNY